MNGHGASLAVDPWRLHEPALETEHLGQTESLFALSNGYLGMRGNLDEGEPNGTPGTYLSSFFENHPLPYAEKGYGNPESGQTLVNVTNGKIIRLLVDDQAFEVRTGRLLAHERTLDFRTGTLHRYADWVSPADKRVRVRSTRLVSFTHRSIAAIAYEVEAVDREARIIVQSELIANEAPPDVETGDPRVADALDSPLVATAQDVERRGAVLSHRTRRSGLITVAGMEHDIESPVQYDVEHEAKEDWARTTVVTKLAPGQTLRIVKYVGYGWSSARSDAAVRAQVAAALTAARYTGWDGLERQQEEYLTEFWDGADVEVDGDPVIQQAMRFSLFHVLQAGARSERQGIGAKGLTGSGYGGHVFWDVEGFVIPVLALTVPTAAADALRWRAATLERARDRARTLGLAGATFPWRTINGEETSAYWPAGTAALHINADVARAFQVYRAATGSDELERECGLEVLVETARLWMSAGHHDDRGRWHVNGVTGPDEYTAVVDDNVFTNLAAVLNLRVADAACGRHPDVASSFGVTEAERANWRQSADAVYLPYDSERQVHRQSENFTRLDEWDFHGKSDRYPLLLHEPYFQLYRKQVIKQADLVLAMHWFSAAFSAEEKARNFDYYERRTVRDSSLSACTQAVIAAEVGHLDLAREYLHEAALVDLRNLHRNAHHGLHIASLAGAWIALVSGFGGLRLSGDDVHLRPGLPDEMSRLVFNLRSRGSRLRVEVTHEEVRCTARDPESAPVRFRLYGEQVELRGGESLTRPTRRAQPLLPRPTQPPGREPEAVDGI